MAEKEPDWASAHARRTVTEMPARQLAASRLIAGGVRLRHTFDGATAARQAKLRSEWPELYDAIREVTTAIEGYK